MSAEVPPPSVQPVETVTVSDTAAKVFYAVFKNMENKMYWAEPLDSAFYCACFSEFMAMLFFQVLSVGGAMTTLHAEHPNLLEISMSFGFGIMVIAQWAGPLSGAHINCAVTFALYLAGRVSGTRFIFYTLAQILGAVAGAIILLMIFGSNYNGSDQNFASNEWDPNVFNGGQVFLAEMFGTAILIFNVFATIDHPMAGGGALGIFPISMSVLVAHLYLIPIDGCSINPTRSFGPYLIASMVGHSGNWKNQQYMFWFAPMIGAAISTLIYEYGSLKPSQREGGGDLRSNLHLVEKHSNPAAVIHDGTYSSIVEEEAKESISLVDKDQNAVSNPLLSV